MRRFFTLAVSLFLLVFTAALPAEIVDWTLATVDNETVTFSQWEAAWAELRAAEAEMKKAGIPLPSAAQVLDRLISAEILSLEAKKKQIDVSEEDVNDRIERIKKLNNLTDELFRRALREQGMKLEDLKEQFRTQIRNEKLQQMEILPRVARPREEDLRAYYDKNKTKMMSPEKRRVSHILFLQDEKLSLADQVNFKKTLEKVVQDAQAGKDFAKLAAEHSQDEASRENGGDLGWIERGFIAPEFEEAVFKLRRGRVSDLFPSRSGLHIAKVTDIRPSAPLSYDDAKNGIRDTILQESLEAEFARWVDEKKSVYGIRVILRDGRFFLFERSGWTDSSGRLVSEKDLSSLLAAESGK